MRTRALIDSKQRIGALLILAFSVAYLRLAVNIPLDAAGTDEVFSARTLPIGISVVAIVLSLLQLALPAAAADRASEAVRGLQWRQAILLVLLMGTYAYAFDLLGFLLASIVFLEAGFLILGERRIVRSLLVSVGLVVFMWALLTQVFGLYLDDGAIFRAIGG